MTNLLSTPGCSTTMLLPLILILLSCESSTSLTLPATKPTTRSLPKSSTLPLSFSLSVDTNLKAGSSSHDADDQHESNGSQNLHHYRVAVVTGSSRGIGRGIAFELGRSDEGTSSSSSPPWVVYCVGRSSRNPRSLTVEDDARTKKGTHWKPRVWPWLRRRRQNDSRSDGDKMTCKLVPTLFDDQRPVDPSLDLTVESIAEEISSSSSGRSYGIPIPCDLSNDEAIESLFEQVRRDHGRLDLLVCSAYTTPPSQQSTSTLNDNASKTATTTGLRGNFWDQSMDMWDAVNGIGLRQVYACCRAAAPLMIETAQKSVNTGSSNYNADLVSSSSPPPPLICLVSSFGGKSYTFNVAYGVGKAGIDRMAVDMSHQLSKYGVATTALYPGLVRTEANLQMEIDGSWDEASGGLDLSQGETPRFSGRAVVELTKLPKDEMMKRSGQVEVVAELAAEFDFTDVDMSRPPSIRSLRYLLPNFVFPTIEKESGRPIPDWIKNNIPDLLLPWSVFSSGPPPEMDTR